MADLNIESLKIKSEIKGKILENVKFVPKTTLMQKIKASKDNILEMIDRRIVNKKEVVSNAN